MKTHRENPEGPDNQEATEQNERKFFATVAQKLHALQGTMKTIEQQAVEYAEALCDIADILDLPTGATPAEIVGSVRLLRGTVDRAAVAGASHCSAHIVDCNAYGKEPVEYQTISQALNDNRIVNVTKQPDGRFQVIERCDDYYSGYLTREQLLAWSVELRSLAGAPNSDATTPKSAMKTHGKRHPISRSMRHAFNTVLLHAETAHCYHLHHAPKHRHESGGVCPAERHLAQQAARIREFLQLDSVDTTPKEP